MGLLQGWRPLLYGVLLDLHFCVPKTAVLRLRPGVVQDVVGGLMWVGGEFLGLWMKCVPSQIVKAVSPKDAQLDLVRGLIFVVLPFGLGGLAVTVASGVWAVKGCLPLGKGRFVFTSTAGGCPLFLGTSGSRPGGPVSSFSH